ncbi:MerR family transcriptional regulator [Streptomyces sp. P38-E01]|uniref:MerR family transcriptional regulator n=1 Tax=Streptomyces tardus TaxID=2780544 RepID=A0A949JT91_9ACTN|nr:MerR family transcriptional regulator [Streptomyces tardus]MBU7600826.1 MerR family transcriptional regulator [Streptomyces tardus]
MGWSTNQLADLAGTTLRTVRHYHDVGLLKEPDRRANGYKSYGVPHLVRVLRIRRLVDLGLSLPQIGTLEEDTEHPGEALHELDAELAAAIERMQRTRAELSVILHQKTPVELPPELAAAFDGVRVSEADRSLNVVLAHLLAPEVLSRYAESVRDHAEDPVLLEFDELPPDADEPTRRDLAARLHALPVAKELRETFPAPAGVCADAPRGEKFTQRALVEVITELYSNAQLDVLRRMTV